MKAPLGFLLTLLVTLGHPILAQEGKVGDRRITQSASTTTIGAKRVALVIGNGAYPTAPLKNPVNDARAMSVALRSLGFEVTYLENLTQKNMKLAIRAFGKKITGGDVGLFYFAGHGIQVNEYNYLIPIDSSPASEEEVEFEAVRADEILAQMARAENGMNIVILDACRNNPFARSFRSNSQGLRPMNAPTGTIIAYATEPGGVASDGAGTNNGIYTQSLLKFMRMPGLSIEEVFKRVRIAVLEVTGKKQKPWEASSLTGDFYFTDGKTSPSTLAVVETVSPSIGPPSKVGGSSSAGTNGQSATSQVNNLPTAADPAEGKEQGDAERPSSLNVTGSYLHFYGPAILESSSLLTSFEVMTQSADLTLVTKAVIGGSLSEVIARRKVFVSAMYSIALVPGANPDAVAKEFIIKTLATYPGVEVVDTAEASDFIIQYAADESRGFGLQNRDVTTVGDMVVIVRGDTRPDGVQMARIIWKDHESRTESSSSPLYKLSRHPAENMTRHLISALKKLRGEK